MTDRIADYVVAGGGLCGCVVASRLNLAGFSVILIETGPGFEETSKPDVLASTSAFTLASTNPHLLHHYTSTPQRALHNRTIGIQAGRILGGGCAVNYAAGTRGHREDYNQWARLVGDDRWSYDKLLPYFKKSETYHDPDLSEQHGDCGPIKVSTGPRGYPLEHHARDALQHAGLQWNPDGNSGDPNGIGRLVESWQDGKRSFASKEYDLSGVEIVSSSHVAKVILEPSSRSAKGVELVDETQYFARKEVILCCGAARTPQVLMLSGIGPQKTLEKLGIATILDLPVGENLMDHGAVHLTFRVKGPEKGYALGFPGFNNPKFFEGVAIDFMAFAAAPDADLKMASNIDHVRFERGPRCDYEIALAYAPGPPIPGMAPYPIDGTLCGMSIACFSPTSRGCLTLSDTNPLSEPVIDPAYFTTEHDKAVIRAAMRTALRAAESPAGQSFIADEQLPDTFNPLHSGSTDIQLDARLRACSTSFNHLAGTAAMAKVTDSHCRVMHVKNLRVIDASIIPIAISAHLQAPLYAIAESAADLIINGE